jgi:elongation factor 1-alpha
MGSQWEDKSKPHLNIVFIGHVDHGKSTTVGRLLLDSGHIEGHVIEKNEKLAQEAGKAGFGLAYVMDGLKEERERGITIDVAHKEFFTPNYYWTVIDAPGHRDFVKNMITGASQADAAVLLCAANDGVNAQTKEHAFLAKVLGVKQIIVHVNKMDISGVDWSEEKYKTACAEVGNLLKMAGFKPDDIPMIPASSLLGDNVYNKSENCSWYKGPTLFEAIDKLTMPNKPVNKPLRLPIQDVYKISGIGTVPVGKIETGTLNVGKTVVFNPSQKSAEVKSIEMHHTMVPKAEPGDNVGFNVRGLAQVDIRRGDVAGYTDNEPMFVRHDETFVGQIQLIFQRQFLLDTHLFSTHTPHKLQFVSSNFSRRPTKLVRKLTRLSSRLVTHVSSVSNQTSQWQLSKWIRSLNSPASLSVTWVRPSQLAFV